MSEGRIISCSSISDRLLRTRQQECGATMQLLPGG